jgi:hypothetical protein
MPLADMVLAGSDFIGSQVAESGGGIGDILTRFSHLFPQESSGSLNAAARRAYDAWQAAQSFEDYASDRALRAGEVPPPIQGNLGWRYSAIALYGPPGEEADEARYMYLTSPGSLTRGEVEAYFDSLADELLEGGGRVGESGPVGGGRAILLISLVGVGRWTT